jgi:predicted CoA-substrate-specific enzyme activase
VERLEKSKGGRRRFLHPLKQVVSCAAIFMKDIFLGIDIGSTTVKVVVVDRAKHLLDHRYIRSEGRPRPTLLRAVQDLQRTLKGATIVGVGLTGSGGEVIARIIGGNHVNELIAQTRAIGAYYPQARTVIEIGGQDSKFLSTQWDEKSGKMMLVDFSMNALCAAGTGSFLDQQAERLGISIEEEFGNLALQSNNPARIAGRCTVFAKSDMIHLQQKGTPLPDIIAGLCLALARNFKSVIGKGKDFTPPVLFQGGVAYNRGVVRAFETVLGLKPGELMIPDNHPLMAALGTAFVAMDQETEASLPTFVGFSPLEEAVQASASEQKIMPPLTQSGFPLPTYHAAPVPRSSLHLDAKRGRLPVYLGIDVGSISTNVVLVDEQAQVVARRYLPTQGRPLEAVRRALYEIGTELGELVEVRGVGTTGSGRHLTADFVGGDVVRNEITAQARAATVINPEVDTIFEIGGQDSKYISLDHGAVVDFTMNSACAAGTGSFLEEQADRLNISIKEDFSHLALATCCPTGLGERCTVFMESDIIHHQQHGAKVEQLTAGLAYAIAQNYLNRVVSGRPIGKNIFFQGGVAWNQSVVAAFQELLKRPITVPPHHDVTGAIGAAVLAMEEMQERHARNIEVPTRFKGFDLGGIHYETTNFECRACPNLCEVSRVTISGQPPVFYGARCDKFEESGRKSDTRNISAIPDLFTERTRLLLGDYTRPEGGRNGRMRIAIPRAMVFHDVFPYWRTFFQSLDIEIVLSEATNPQIARQALEHAGVETCYPAKLVYGHVLDLMDKAADFVFLPGIVGRENIAPGQKENNYCPYIPASSYLVSAHVDLESKGMRPLRFPIQMRWEKTKKKDLREIAHQLGVSARRINEADEVASEAQRAFYATVRQRGQEILTSLDGSQFAAVIVGRPYNTSDLSVCQDLPLKLRKLGILPIPMDFLPVDQVDITDQHPNMFWRSGQDILATAKIVSSNPHLQAVYVTSFNCGPDSFLLSFFRRLMGSKPFLELEMDEHSADAGIITRCEAFFDSLKMGKGAIA